MAPTALVTGPTAGIGAAFAAQLAQRGYDLVLVARQADRLTALAAEIEREYDVQTEVLVADLTDRDELARVEARLTDPNRPVDLLVNNAGFGLKKPFHVNDVEDEQQMLDVLVTAVMRLTHAALRSMVERGGGSIINVSSVAGFLQRGSYGAAKAYVIALSEWADLTYRPDGVHVMALCPGFTKTEFHERMDVSRGSAPAWLWLDANRLVADALKDLERGRRVSVPGAPYKAVAALARYVPQGLVARAQHLGRR